MNVNDVIESAGKFDLCNKLDGVSNWSELTKSLMTAQGREFCEKNKFPSLEEFRSMDSDLTKYDVYIDAGDIQLSNPKRAVVVGNTDAEINITDNTRVIKILVYHGARVTVNASNYSVVLVVNIDGNVQVDNDNTAKIL